MIYYRDICYMYITLKFDYYKQKSNTCPIGLICHTYILMINNALIYACIIELALAIECMNYICLQEDIIATFSI